MNRRWLFALAAGAALIAVTVAGHAGDDPKPAGAKPAVAKGPDPLAAKVGNPCTEQFRRDLLGAASDKPISPTVAGTAGFGAAGYAVTGRLSQVSDDWVVVDGGNRAYYIPRDAVLLVEVHSK